MNIENFKSHLSMLLRDQPIGTTADLSDFAIAWWNGHSVTYAFLLDAESGRIEEEFDLDDYGWKHWEPDFAAWVEAPKFSARDEVLRWRKDAPPNRTA
ncbi:hypothetical protein [Paraburkholderia sp. RL17-337-BIB-A]|uniref:hypothetical protein n=1 Tax=Paraburkholderia sp. RL17-337-BIB-A TaxID=3031636 RepID=UPI0038BC4CB2